MKIRFTIPTPHPFSIEKQRFINKPHFHDKFVKKSKCLPMDFHKQALINDLISLG